MRMTFLLPQPPTAAWTSAVVGSLSEESAADMFPQAPRRGIRQISAKLRLLFMETSLWKSPETNLSFPGKVRDRLFRGGMSFGALNGCVTRRKAHPDIGTGGGRRAGASLSDDRERRTGNSHIRQRKSCP